VEHDLTFTLYGQLAERTGQIATGQEYRRWLNFERKSFQDYDAVWMMSDEDRATALREGALAERTLVVPNGVDINWLRPGGSLAAAPEILYVGSFRHLPNLIGFETLLEEVMPRVWNQHRSTKLMVVSGPDPETYLQAFYKGRKRPPLDPRVWLHAFVPDLRPFYEKAWVVVAPLVVSAGTNIKILEAMACGKAIVGTPIAVNGLGLYDDQEALIRADWSQFAEAVANCLANPAIRVRLGAEARGTVEQRFQWGHIAERAFECYLKLAATHRKAAPVAVAGTALAS
jgi:glycosyltransferase involved in cell wall biosynthesis